MKKGPSNWAALFFTWLNRLELDDVDLIQPGRVGRSFVPTLNNLMVLRKKNIYA